MIAGGGNPVRLICLQLQDWIQRLAGLISRRYHRVSSAILGIGDIRKVWRDVFTMGWILGMLYARLMVPHA